MYQLLIVDDEELTIKVLKKEVNWAEIEIDTIFEARSVKRAIEILQDEEVDLVICDIEMPELNGIKLVEWINENKPDAKVIIFTGHSDFEYVQTLLRLHVFDYILKPADYKTLCA